MRIVAFRKSGRNGLALERDGELVDLALAAPDLPGDLKTLLRAGPRALKRAAAAVRKAKASARLKGRFTYLPPLPDPGKIVCIGLNYRDHAAEANQKIPDYPVLFARFTSTLVGHNQPLIRPKVSSRFDYEGEMVIVIGKTGRAIPKSRALDHVAGYSVFNEGSVRDFQMRTPQWTAGKIFDGSGGFGPAFVSADELPAGARGLKIQTRLNGRVLQDANTRSMIFDVRTLVNVVSTIATLEPGDIIVSGTPAGVGFARKPPIFMKPGDVCEVEIEGIGTLVNPVVAER